MDDEAYTLRDLWEIVETEGLGYAIEDYVNSDRIADREVSRIWKEAERALGAVRAMLKAAEPTEDE